MDSIFSSTFSPPPSSSYSLFLRGGSLVILVILFQWFVARAPTLQTETKRRFQHALTGHALVQISYVLPKTASLILLLVGAIGIYCTKTFFFEHFINAFGQLLRPNEASGDVMPGAFYFLLGTAITISGLVTDDITIARYAVECLAISDPIASWIGTSIKSPKISMGSSSSLSGCIACFVSSLAIGWWMLLLQQQQQQQPNSDVDVKISAAEFTGRRRPELLPCCFELCRCKPTLSPSLLNPMQSPWLC